MQTDLLVVKGLTVHLSGIRVLNDVSFSVEAGQCLAIVGRSGSGKTTLIKALSGQIFSRGEIRFASIDGRVPNITVISRQHKFTNLSNISSFYYQQRFNSFDAEDSHTVEDELNATGANEELILQTLRKLRIEHLAGSGLIQLSNGEHKRFQIAKALLQQADWLLLDSPYIGLDVSARQSLNEMLHELVSQGINIFLVTSFTEIPGAVTQVAVLDAGSLTKPVPREEFMMQRADMKLPTPALLDIEAIMKMPSAYYYQNFSTAVKMTDTSIRYNDKLVLDTINWEVKKGERWHLAGHNGSGKSTLLSLINGDNPQAFANEIWLFDRKKGSGESIWDIKQKIGYVSPELHHYFDAGTNCFDLVASGLFDTIGLFRKLNADQEKLTQAWMHALHLDQFTNRMFHGLSDGEQRRILLARAMVKNPPMLILDEPCQGLDEETTKAFNLLVDHICLALGKTLIYVSHYESELPSCITKKVVLSEGRQVSSVQ